MESQCDYSMYFPAVPFGPRELLSAEPGRYRSLPRRNHLFLGETVRFLLVLRCRPGPRHPPWPQVVSSLAALASVSPGPGERGAEGGEDGDGDEGAPSGREDRAAFRECRVLLTQGSAAGERQEGVRGGGEQRGNGGGTAGERRENGERTRDNEG
uniref:TRAPP14 N-terminal domain-containing protein n=1 Tax=Amazona collaria TaxID=241587 RepID=A0A8B9IXW0_9PSIT